MRMLKVLCSDFDSGRRPRHNEAEWKRTSRCAGGGTSTTTLCRIHDSRAGWLRANVYPGKARILVDRSRRSHADDHRRACGNHFPDGLRLGLGIPGPAAELRLVPSSPGACYPQRHLWGSRDAHARPSALASQPGYGQISGPGGIRACPAQAVSWQLRQRVGYPLDLRSTGRLALGPTVA
jgi:hypothetical protein